MSRPRSGLTIPETQLCRYLLGNNIALSAIAMETELILVSEKPAQFNDLIASFGFQMLITWLAVPT